MQEKVGGVFGDTVSWAWLRQSNLTACNKCGGEKQICLHRSESYVENSLLAVTSRKRDEAFDYYINSPFVTNQKRFAAALLENNFLIFLRSKFCY
jgi:hypothetical protein